jgi:ATP-binding cassette, subfamily C, bacterial LapB
MLNLSNFNFVSFSGNNMIIDKLKYKNNLFSMLFLLPNSLYNSFFLVLSSLTINILSLALPVMLIQIYDRIISNASYGSLTWLAVGAATAIILESILRTLRGAISSWIGASFENLLTNSVLERILYCRLSDFKKHETGAHLDRLNAISTLKSVYSGQIFQLMMDFPFAIIYLVIIWYLATYLVLIPITVILLYYIVVLFLKNKIDNVKEQNIKNEENRYSFLINIIKNIFLVKAQALEEPMLRRYEGSLNNVSHTNHTLNKWTNIPNAIGSFLSQASLFGVILIGGIFVVKGTLTLGVVTACIILVGRCISPFTEIAGFILRYSDIKLAISRIKEVANMELEYPTTNNLMTSNIYGKIQLENISFKHSNADNFLFKNINLEIDIKEFISISGNVGSGLSTFSKIILGRLLPTSGFVSIDGFSSSEWNISTVNRQVKYLSGSGAIFNGSVIDNITVFNPENNIIANETASLLGLNEIVGSMPNGYETNINTQSTGLLPKGFVERVSFARCLVTRPRILILDNFDTALDAETEKLIVWLLAKLKNSMTIIALTNNEKIINHADKKYKFENHNLINID